MRTSLRTMHRVATAAVIGYALLVVTGGAVRLTGSGLGCPDWPSCYAHRVTAKLSFNPLVEFSNRLVSVAVTIISIAALAVAIRLAPHRKDLVGRSAALVGGVLAQVVLGGLVVYFHLNPYLVALHFLITFVVLAAALSLRARSAGPTGPAIALVDPALVWLSRFLVATLCVLVTIGTVVSGAGPHAGGVGAKRVDIAFRDIAELHSTVAIFLIGCTLATLVALHQARAPGRVQRGARILLEVLALQGIIGYTQFFLHDNAAVVELHLAGATVVWIAAVTYYLGLRRVVPDAAIASTPEGADDVPAVSLAEAP